MVVKMMRWRPWPPLVSRKYEVILIVKRLLSYDQQLRESDARLMVEIKWKGNKSTLLRRSSVAKNFTKDAAVAIDDAGATIVNWDEEFQNVCNLNAYKDNNVFHPWEIAFSLVNGLNERTKKNVPVIGTALLNIAEFVCTTDQKDFDLNIPLKLHGGSADQPSPSLCISISLVELRAAQESTESVQRIVPVASSPPVQSGETTTTVKDDLSVIKAGLKKVKIFTEYVSSRKAQKSCREEEGSDGKGSRSKDGEYNYPLDSESLDDFEEGDSNEGNEESNVSNSFSYGPLAYANAGWSFSSNTRVNCDDEDWVYYNYRKPDVGCLQMEESTVSSSKPYSSQSSKRGILFPWRKRKLSFRSPKAVRGEPLLKKAYAEDGGDDIDFDRRQLSSDESFSSKIHKTGDDSCANQPPVSEFGDDNFAVGCWEQKEVMSRDGHMKLQTQVFFASIDQRSERAAGESACTTLVAVIADWFQNYPHLMPIKSQLDSLIREGSSEWRNLCDKETYRARFPDRHFDLETIIEAKIRPLCVCPTKSFIGFFHPEGMDEERFDFLQGSMSFDNIWDEISGSGQESLSSGEPHVYVVSWNDHFFILKVESDCYYIIDTLGERLYEGCNQAYILKFDSNTVIYKSQNVAQSSYDKTTKKQQTVAQVLGRNNKQSQQGNGKEVDSVGEQEGKLKSEQEEEVVCRGKEACKEYIKSFLAAIPIRELQADMIRNLVTSPHHRLQIEFHYTQLLQPCLETPVVEASMVAPETLACAITEISA